MDGYKQIIKSQKTRMAILKFLSFVPDAMMIKTQYRIKLKRKLNLKNPQRYTEKMQWYKLYYRDPVMTTCVDKYSVRQYVKDRIGDSFLTKLYQVCSAPEEISFEQLPEKFIIKTTNGSGTNIICTDKSKLDRHAVINTLTEYMSRPAISAGREWAYNNVKNRIVVEELLEDPNNRYGGVNDYKLMCFSGKVYCIVVDVARFTNHKRNFYTPDWKRIDAVSDHDNFEPDIDAPTGLAKMIQIAEKLSAPFPHVRVDLYSVSGHIYFGELTFYPWSGYVQYTPDQFDFDLGKEFELRPFQK